MTALLTHPTPRIDRPPDAGRNAQASKPGSSSAAVGRRRNSGRIAIGILVLVLSVLGALVLFSSTTNRVAVIGVARDVPAGRVITAGDLREVSISGGDGLDVIHADNADRVIGHTTAMALAAGSLMTSRQLTNGPVLQDGTVVTGAVLKPGQYPVGLAIGDSVDVVETTPPDATGAGQPVSRGHATVTDMHEPSDGQSLLAVSLAIPPKDSASISSAGAAGRLSVLVTTP